MCIRICDKPKIEEIRANLKRDAMFSKKFVVLLERYDLKTGFLTLDLLTLLDMLF